MRRLLLLVLLAGCPSETIESGICDEATAMAVDPVSGKCVTFGTACDVPLEWEPCPTPSVCLGDDQCASLQHCVGASADAPGSCVDNPSCSELLACEGPQICNLGAGLCERPQPGAPRPDTCVTSSECGPLEICPAEYAGCSAGERDVTCPSHCEKACLVDEACDDGLVCNAPAVCGESNGGADGPPLACAGWCVPGL